MAAGREDWLWVDWTKFFDRIGADIPARRVFAEGLDDVPAVLSAMPSAPGSYGFVALSSSRASWGLPFGNVMRKRMQSTLVSQSVLASTQNTAQQGTLQKGTCRYLQRWA